MYTQRKWGIKMSEEFEEIEFEIEKEISQQVELFNEYDDRKMEVKFIVCSAELKIDGQVIIDEDPISVLERVRQINRENAYHYFVDDPYNY